MNRWLVCLCCTIQHPFDENKIESANNIMVIVIIIFLLFDWELHSNGVCEIGITIYIKGLEESQRQ